MQIQNYSDDEIDQLKVNLFSSLLYFTKFFYEIRYNRPFIISNPINRISHYKVITDELENVFRGKTTRLVVEAPPRYGKTELLINFFAWTYAWNPASNYIYTSYGRDLAVDCTSQIKDLMQHPVYKYLFDTRIKDDTDAKNFFKTTKGGALLGVGAKGAITGKGAGIFGSEEFAGCIVVDDIIKPEDAISDVIREGRNEWFFRTLLSRLNDPSRTPIIVNNQRTHEADLSGTIREKYVNSKDWRYICIPALDGAGNALCPEKHTKEQLLELKELSPYVFAAQMQQQPQPAGGAIFKDEWFQVLDKEPQILLTFITADTAETDKTYNDWTVFSFWGIYKIEQFDMLGLHWLDCLQTHVEPCDLEKTFFDFYYDCMRHPVKPFLSAIEKKSSGVTLSSVLDGVPGLRVEKIERDISSFNKNARFLHCQPFVAQKRISFTRDAKHLKMCRDHCIKLTPNGAHRFDDIGDTLADAIRMTFVDNIFAHQLNRETSNKKAMLDVISSSKNNIKRSRMLSYGYR